MSCYSHRACCAACIGCRTRSRRRRPLRVVASCPYWSTAAASHSGYVSEVLADMISSRLQQIGEHLEWCGSTMPRPRPPIRRLPSRSAEPAPGRTTSSSVRSRSFGEGASLDVQLRHRRQAETLPRQYAQRRIFIQSGERSARSSPSSTILVDQDLALLVSDSGTRRRPPWQPMRPRPGAVNPRIADDSAADAVNELERRCNGSTPSFERGTRPPFAMRAKASRTPSQPDWPDVVDRPRADPWAGPRLPYATSRVTVRSAFGRSAAPLPDASSLYTADSLGCAAALGRCSSVG